MSPEIDELTPRAFGTDELEDETVLVLGAPYVGKTHRFRELDAVDRVTTLPDALAETNEGLTVVDEFYRAYQAADTETRAEFVSWLKHSNGVCVSVRPRAFDWLLEHAETRLTEDSLDAFDSVYHLRYDPDSERSEAVDHCLEIGGEDVNGLDRETVSDAIGDVLDHVISFENETLDETIGEQRTLVPGLVAYFSDQLDDASEALVSRSIREVATERGREFFQTTALTDLINRTSATEFFSLETLSSIKEVVTEESPVTEALGRLPEPGAVGKQAGEVTSPAALSSFVPFLGPAAGGGLAIAVWWAMGDDGPGQNEMFETLAGEEMTPTASVALERELDLPPRTVDNFQRLTRGNLVEELLAHRDRIEAEFEALDTDLATIEEAVEDNREDLDALAGAIDALGTATIDAGQVAAFVSAAVSDATWDLDYLKDAIRREEATFLGEETAADLDLVEDVPYFGSKDGDLIEWVDDDETDLIVLRGPIGTGKTTAAYRACRQLRTEGKSVRIPRFSDRTSPYIEPVVAHGPDSTVVYTSYGRGTGKFGQSNLRTVLELASKDVCDAVVVECRDELYGELKDRGDREAGSNVVGTDVDAVWNNREEIPFRRRGDDEQIKEIARWTLENLGYEGVESAVTEVVRFAEGHPEMAKLAARGVSERSVSLEDIETFDDLVWTQINASFDHDAPEWQVFKHVCLFRTPTTTQLEALTGEDASAYTDQIEGYLAGEITQEQVPIDPEWGVAPDFFAEVVFRREALVDGDVDDYLRKAVRNDQSSLFAGLAQNLAVTYDTAGQPWTEASVRQSAREGASTLLDRTEHVDDETLYRCVWNLTFGGVPIDFDVFESNPGRLLSGSVVDAESESVDPDTIQENLLARLLVSHLGADTAGVPAGEADTGDDITEVTASLGVLDQNEIDSGPGEFLENVYSMALVNLAKSNDEPGSVEGWIDVIEQRAIQTADTDAHSDDPGQFLENVYSMALEQLAQSNDEPGSVEGWIDVIEQRAIQTADTDAHRTDPGVFLENVYSMALKKLSDSNDEPGSVEEWIDVIEQRAIQTADTDAHRTDPGVFLENVYSMALSKLARSNDEPGSVEGWIDVIEQRAIQTADTDAHRTDPGEFLANVYSMALSNLADSNDEPGSVEEWIDVIEQRAIQTADTDAHRTDPGEFLANVYSMALKKLSDSNDEPGSVEEWIDVIEQRAIQTADTDAHRTDPGVFLENVYSMALEQLAQSNDEPGSVEGWIDVIEQRAIQTADTDAHHLDPGQFLANIYSMALKKLSDSNDEPGSVEAWIEDLLRRSVEATPTNEDLPDPTPFLAHVTAIALGQIETSPAVARPREWDWALLQRSMATVEDADLAEFSTEFQRLYHIACLQVETLPQALPISIVALLGRTTDEDLTASEEDVDLIAGAVTDAVFMMWVFGDRDLEYDPGRGSIRAVGSVADSNVALVTAVVEAVDHRLATREVADWLLGQADDEPGRPLRDRVVGHAYARALESLGGDDDTDQAETLATTAQFADTEPTTRLYRAGIRAILDRETDVAVALLELAWTRRDLTDPGTDAHEHAIAAGAGYAAYLVLFDEPDTPPAEIARDALERAETFSEPVSALLDVARDQNPDTDLSALRNRIDEEADTHDLDELEVLAYDELLSRIVDPPGVSEYYIHALELMSQRNDEQAVPALQEAWAGRHEAEDQTARTDAVGAGVALLAYVELGTDADLVDREAVVSAVENDRDSLPAALLAVFDAVTDGEPAHDPDELTDGIDPDDEDFDRVDLETMIFADLLEAIQGTPAETAVDQPAESASPDDQSTGAESSDESPSVTEFYEAGLTAIAQEEFEDTIQAFVHAWDNHEETTTDDGYADALAAGVFLLAYAEVEFIDLENEVRRHIVETADEYREALSDPVLALYRTVVGESPATTPGELRASVDQQTGELSRDDLERLIVAEMLDQSDTTDTRDTTGDDTATNDETDDELRSLYEEGLTHTCERDRLAAIGPLMDAWGYHDEATGVDRARALAAGVALAVHIADDPTLAVVREEVVETVSGIEDCLPDPARPVFAVTTGDEADTTPEQLRQGADSDDLAGLEARAFAELLASHEG